MLLRYIRKPCCVASIVGDPSDSTTNIEFSSGNKAKVTLSESFYLVKNQFLSYSNIIMVFFVKFCMFFSFAVLGVKRVFDPVPDHGY